ncbi:MAG: hypothetical protein OHK0013_16420 [Sandaracinaceae bacterium]
MSQRASIAWQISKALAAVTALTASALATSACALVIDSGQYVGGGADAGIVDAGDLDAPGLDAPDLDAGSGGPPRLASVALDNYWPFVGETIRAIPVGLADPGSAAIPTVRYQWFLNDMPIEGATSNALGTTSLAPGGSITLSAYAEDADGLRSESVTVGPVRLRPDVTAWRPILPDAPSFVGSGWVWDARHERVIFVARGTTWEIGLEGSRPVVRALDPTGVAPPPNARLLAMYDPERDRALFAEVEDLRNVFILDLARRGGEAWSLVAAAGDVPSPRVLASHVYDPERDVFWVFGGLEEAVGLHSDLYTLSADGSTWTAQTVTGSPLLPLAGANMFMDPTRSDRFFIVGGLAFSAMRLDATDAVYAVTPADGRVTVERLAGLAESRFASTVLVRERDVLLLGGALDFSTLTNDIIRFDPSTGGSAVTMATTTIPSGFGLVGVRSTQPPLLWPGFGSLSSSGSVGLVLGVLRPDGSTESTATLPRPAPLSEAIGAAYGGVARLFGGSNEGVPSGLVWELDLTTQRFSLVTPAADVASGTSPVARSGFVMETTSTEGTLAFFGGRVDTTVLGDEGWSLRGTQWTQHTYATGFGPIEGRYGAAAVDPRCGGTVFFMIGGEDPSGRAVLDPVELICDPTSRRGCRWEIPPLVGLVPEARSFGAVFEADRRVYLFGGRNGSRTPLGDFAVFSVCGGGLPVSVPTLEGTAPEARWGHSITRRDGAPTVSFVLFGGRGTDERDLDDAVLVTVPTSDVLRLEALESFGEVRPLGRTTHVAFWDRRVGRLLVYGGSHGSEDLGDLWELRVRHP